MSETTPELAAESPFPTFPPTRPVDAVEAFGFDPGFPVHGFEADHPLVPETDPDYQFEPATTRAILAGFGHDRRVLVHGPHGTGKSTHLEQVAARLGWPLVRVNLDSHVSRWDLVGKETLGVADGKPVSRFKPGILTWALTRPVALVLDEYDAGRPDVMFVLQRVLEARGSLTLLDQARVLHPHPGFRLMATANTLGRGDQTGLYQGTQVLNQGQLDRWGLVTRLDYLEPAEEARLVAAKVPAMAEPGEAEVLGGMVAMADLIRNAFLGGSLAAVMSPRMLIHWAESYRLFGDLDTAFRLTFLDRCEGDERTLVAELYQRCFDRDLPGVGGTLV